MLSSSWLSKEIPKRLFLESDLTKFLTVCYFGNILAMTMIIFKKIFKIWWKFKKNNKKLGKSFRFQDNCVWIDNGKFSQSGTGYLSSGANVLTNTSKISSFNKRYCSKPFLLRVMKKCNKRAFMQISQVFGTLEHVDSQKNFWDGGFLRVV